MPIDKSNFKFQSHYTGLWSCINNPKEQFSGTLFIDQQKIWIELCYIDSRQELLENIDSLDGCTYSIDSTGKETADYLKILIRWMDVLIQLIVQVKKQQ